MTFEPWQIALSALAALLVGFSKTGVPGSGILAVPLMAMAFGGRLSIGTTLPMLIAADCFAVAFYRAHADWANLRRLYPFVGVGLVVGTGFLMAVRPSAGGRDPVNVLIGVLILAMIAVQLSRRMLGDRLLPTSPTGTAVTGAVAGFSTMTSNAGGPVMQIYLTASGFSKITMMGTAAWYFFTVNLAKLPFVALLTLARPSEPLWTPATLRLDVLLFPLIAAGALLGRKLLAVIPEKSFTTWILIFSGLGGLKLLLG